MPSAHGRAEASRTLAISARRTHAALAAGPIDPRPLVAATVGLDAVATFLGGGRPAGAGPGPKIHIDPRRTGTSP